MASVDDTASDIEELHRNQALARRRPEGPKAVGKCLNCGAPMDDPRRRWCDADCRDEWEAEHG